MTMGRVKLLTLGVPSSFTGCLRFVLVFSFSFSLSFLLDEEEVFDFDLEEEDDFLVDDDEDFLEAPDDDTLAFLLLRPPSTDENDASESASSSSDGAGSGSGGTYEVGGREKPNDD